MRTLAMVGLLLLAVVACGSACRGGVHAELRTSVGMLVIDEARLTDRWPPGCGDQREPCQYPGEGYRFLVVSLEVKDQDEASDMMREAAELCQATYVVAGDGSRTPCEAWTYSALRSQVALGFVPTGGAHDFRLFAPDNPAVDLDE